MAECCTYIVTGGAGFIGSNLVAALIHSSSPAQQPPHVVVLDNFSSGSFENIISACQRAANTPSQSPDSNAGTHPGNDHSWLSSWAEGKAHLASSAAPSVFTGEVVSESLSQVAPADLIEHFSPTAIFHLAAITDTTVADEKTMIQTNAGLAWAELVQACVDSDTPLVYASSAATYGSPPQAHDHIPFPISAAGKPNNVYGFSKWLMECEHARVHKARIAQGETPPQIVGLRYFNVFGPGECHKSKMASMARQLTEQMLQGNRPRLFTDGTQARDQIHVDDVVSCTMAAAGIGIGGGSGGGSGGPTPGVYNVGTGTTTSFNQIIQAVRTGLGLAEEDLPTEYFPMPDHIREFYQDYTCADISINELGLGWVPRVHVLESIATYAQMIRDCIA